jgi:hypothetical protein
MVMSPAELGTKYLSSGVGLGQFTVGPRQQSHA